jgi:hypothetical protein
MLAVSGHNPKLYTITKDIYLDSSTRDLDQIKNIEIIFDYAEETSVKLGDVFLPGEEKPLEDKDWKFWIILWVCCAVILLIGVIVCYLKFKGNTITDFGGVEDKGYNSMSDKDRTSSNLQESRGTIKSNLTSSILIHSNQNSSGKLGRSEIYGSAKERGYIDSEGRIVGIRG